MLRVLICGDRNWSDIPSIENLISQLPANSTIISGGCKGADTIASDLALKYKLPLLVFTAQWDIYGRAAGPIRNKQMLTAAISPEQGKVYNNAVGGPPTHIVAFHNDIASSKGTTNMLMQGKKANIHCELRTSTGQRTVY